jgi:hypothetical protein
MSLNASLLHASVGPHHPVGERLREWLAPHSEKTVARKLGGIDLRTARSIRQGNWPCGRHLVALVEWCGVEFLEFVFAPALAESERSLERRLERLEAEAGAIKRDLIREKAERKVAAHSGLAARPFGPVAPDQGEGVDDALAATRLPGRTRRVAGALALICVVALGGLAASFDSGDDDWARLVRVPRIARIHRVNERSA